MNDSPRQINKAYIEIALNHGIADVEQVFAHTNLSLPALEKLDYVDVSVAIQMVHNVDKYTDVPNWPVELGTLLGTSSHGPVGYAALSAPCVGKALSTFSQWFQLRCNVYTASIIESVDYFQIKIEDTTGDTLFQKVFFSAFVRAFEVLVELLLGRFPENELAIYFQSQSLPFEDRCKTAYLSQIHKEQSSNSFFIHKNTWYRRSPLYDKESYEFNLHSCQRLRDELAQKDRLDMRIIHIFNNHFDRQINEKGKVSSPPTLSEVCQQFHMTERTLIRQLKSLNTSYQSILDQQRLAYAKKLLGDVRYNIYVVADLLGYRETANFCRAFKRWTSQSPSDFRLNPREI